MHGFLTAEFWLCPCLQKLSAFQYCMVDGKTKGRKASSKQKEAEVMTDSEAVLIEMLKAHREVIRWAAEEAGVDFLNLEE